MAEQLTE